MTMNNRKTRLSRTYVRVGIFLLLPMMMVSCGSNDWSADPAWITHTGDQGGFTVLLPNGAAEENHTVGTGATRTEINVLRKKHGPESVGVTVGTLKGVAMSMSRNDVLRETMKGAANNTRGEVLTEKFVQLGEVPGIEFTIRVPSTQMIVRQRNYLRGDKLYTLIAAYRENSTLATRVHEFFTSFQLAAVK